MSASQPSSGSPEPPLPGLARARQGMKAALRPALARYPGVKRALLRWLQLYWRGKTACWRGYWRVKDACWRAYWKVSDQLQIAYWNCKVWAWRGFWLAQGWVRPLWRSLWPAPVVRAGRLGRKGAWGRAARIWLKLARRGRGRVVPLAWAEYGRCRFHLGDFMEAEAALQRARQLAPKQALALRLLAVIAAGRRDWRLAAQRWRAALEARLSHKDRVEAQEALVRALLALGEFTAAQAEVQALAASGEAQPAMRAQLALAWHQQDTQAIGKAWRRLHSRFPQKTEADPRWLAFSGRHDPAAVPRYTPEDVLAAEDPATAARALHYLQPRLPGGERLALARQAARAFPGSLALRSLHLECLDSALSCPAELAEYQAAARTFAKRFRGHPEARKWRIGAAIAANDLETASGLLKHSGGTALDDRLQLWLAAMRYGEEDTALSLTQRLRQRRRLPAADDRGLRLRPLNSEPPKRLLASGGSTRILLFACFRNERLLAPWFLRHYRSLGVDWFFIVDAGGRDGTAEFLAKQQDVTVFRSAIGYDRALAGVRWVNALRRRYGQNAWCLQVDADEQLVVPQLESRGLSGFLDGMAERGEEVAPAFQIDMFPADAAAAREFRPGDAPLDAASLMDTDYFFFGRAHCCYRGVQGGALARLTGARATLDRAPILLGGAQQAVERLYLSRHFTSYARPASQGAALLRHSLLHDLLRDGNAPVDFPRAPHTKPYKNSAQLQRLGLLQGSPAARELALARVKDLAAAA